MHRKHLGLSLAVGVTCALAASTAAAQTSGLRVQYKIPQVAAGDNHVRPHINIVNGGSGTVPLSELTLRYWYTVDGVRPQVYVCDWTPRGCGNVASQFVALSPARTGADHYLQLGFTAGMGSLAPGQSTGEIQGRFNKDNWTNYNEADDYSYDPSKLAFADWDRVTLYRNGVLVWGVEPPTGGGGGDFSLSAPASASVTRGASTTSNITVTRTGGFGATVALSASGVPSGVTATFNPVSVTGTSSVLTFAANATASFGTFPVTVTGTGGGLTRTAVINLTVVNTGLTVTLSPASVAVDQGASATTSVSVSGGGTGNSTCSVTGLPAGVSAAFNPTSFATSTTLTLTALATATAGTSTPTVSCSRTGASGSATLSLTVVGPNNFTLSANPTSLSVNPGQSSAPSTITITRTNFTASVTLTASGLPQGVTASFNPASTTGNTSTVTFAAAAGAPAATATVTITGAGGGLTRTTTINVTVGQPTGFTVSITPPSASIPQGGSGTVAVNLSRTGGFTAGVSCSLTGVPAGVTASFNSPSTTGNSMTLTINIPLSTPVGSFTATVTCTGGGLTRTTTLAVTVTPGFLISANPASMTVNQGASGNSTLTVQRGSGFTASLAFSAAPLPTGVTATFNTQSTTGNTSTLTFAAAATATTGTTTVTVTSTGGGVTRTTRITLVVNPAVSSGARFRVNAQGRITRNDQLFPVRCGSWFGLEGRHEPSSDPTNPSGAPMEQYIGNTFWANGGQGTGRTIAQTMSQIAAAGINVIRLPLVPQTLNPNDPQGRDPFLKNHPTVRIANSRLALEAMIRAADQAGIEVMLDMHSCSNFVGWRKGRLDARPPWVDADRDNYDFTRENYSCSATGNPSSVTTIHAYNETAWLNDLRTLAGLGQQLGVDNIIGIDIFNEPWDYTWAEWKAKTEAAYQAINSVNPNILLFVQGISASAGNQDGTPGTITQTPHGDEDTNPNWGENLFEAGANPPNVPRDRLVFSPHTYGPSVFVQKMFMDPNQPGCAGQEGDLAGDANCSIVINPTLLRSGWEEHFGYLKSLGYAVVVGEFGGNLDWPLGQASIRDRNRWSHITPGVDGQWQNAFVDYMVERGIEGCYWSINPESGDTAGWYGHAYDPISNTSGWGEWRPFDDRKTTLLRRFWGLN